MEPGSSPCHFTGTAAAVREDSTGLLDQGPITCVALQRKTDPDWHHPFCTPLSPSGRPLPCCGFHAWSLLGPKPNPNPILNQDPPLKPQPASNPNPALVPLVAWALTSALEGDHEQRVESALATSVARTLTLAKALSPRGPNPTSDNTTRLGSRSGAG